MKVKINVSELLHNAADNHLALVDSQYWIRGGSKEKYSCSAVNLALDTMLKSEGYVIHENHTKYEKLVSKIFGGLAEMGCETGSIALFADPYAGGFGYCLEESQHNRYFWLKWAALMAEEQGVVYEIK